MPEEQLVEMSKLSTIQFFDFLVENNAAGQIENAIKQWLENQLPLISREQVVAEDITLTSFMRKEALIHFLPLYTSDINLMLNIIREIDAYIMESETRTSNTYIDLLKNRIQEETHFKDRIAETSPGIIFVYDLGEKKHVYVNEKMKSNYGFTVSEMNSIENEIFGRFIHPDDLHYFSRRIEDYLTLKDGEMRFFEYRLKSKDGAYRWAKKL